MSTITTRVEGVSRFPWRTVGCRRAPRPRARRRRAASSSGRAPSRCRRRSGRRTTAVIAYSVNGDIVAADSPDAARRARSSGGTDVRFRAACSRRTALGSSSSAARWTAPMPRCGPPTPTARIRGCSPRPRRSAGPSGRHETTSSRSRSTAISPSSGWFARTAAGSTDIKTGLPAAENPIFRPSDGRQMTFRGQAKDGTWGLYLIGRDGSGMQRLDLDPGFRDRPLLQRERATTTSTRPAWSPDGTRLMYHTLEPDPTIAGRPGLPDPHRRRVDRPAAVTADQEARVRPERPTTSSAARGCQVGRTGSSSRRSTARCID